MASRPGEGTTVTVALPAAKRRQQRERASRRRRAARRRLHRPRTWAENHGVTVAPSGSEGVDLAKTGEFDVIVLDLMLPDMHGYDVCQRLRLEGDHTPILMLTAMDALEDKIKGLKLGADDYLTKPFDFDELLARIEALVRRSHKFAPELQRPASRRPRARPRTVGGEARRRHHQAHGQGTRHPRTSMSAPGRVFSRTRILNQVWGYSEDPLTNVVDVYIARLRRKIDTPGREPCWRRCAATATGCERRPEAKEEERRWKLRQVLPDGRSNLANGGIGRVCAATLADDAPYRSGPRPRAGRAFAATIAAERCALIAWRVPTEAEKE